MCLGWERDLVTSGSGGLKVNSCLCLLSGVGMWRWGSGARRPVGKHIPQLTAGLGGKGRLESGSLAWSQGLEPGVGWGL